MHLPAARNAGRRCKGKGTENFWGLQKKFLEEEKKYRWSQFATT